MEAQANVERVVIVGAGLAGLTVAYHLKRLGIKNLILDKGGEIGASWSARHQQLTLNTHRSVSHLPGLQYQSGTPAFPKRDDVVRHLESFAQRHAFPIRFNVDVTGISKAGSCFVITSSTGPVFAEHVVIATGRDHDPRWPQIRGVETFTGQRIHASDFGDVKQYAGKRVLVVGGGNSGFDILNHLCRVDTEEVWLSVRSGSAVLPKRLRGIAVHRLSPLMDMLPSAFADLAIGFTQRLAFGNIQSFGFPKPGRGAATRLRCDHIAIPVDDGAMGAIKAGRIAVVREVDRVVGGTVYLAGGDIVEPDILIAATGYGPRLGCTLGDLSVLDAKGNPILGSDNVSSSVPGLWFSGMTPGLVSYFRSVDREAGKIAAAVAAEPQRPRTAVSRLDEWAED